MCSEEKKWHETYFANSWRPSSRRRLVPVSLAPSDTIRKWRSLNKVTWSSVWGRVTWSSSCQRSFTHTPEKCRNTNTLIQLEGCIVSCKTEQDENVVRGSVNYLNFQQSTFEVQINEGWQLRLSHLISTFTQHHTVLNYLKLFVPVAHQPISNTLGNVAAFCQLASF